MEKRIEGSRAYDYIGSAGSAVSGDGNTLSDVQLQSSVENMGPKVDKSCVMETVSEAASEQTSENTSEGGMAGGGDSLMTENAVGQIEGKVYIK
mgnify:CR=1 FL=1